MTRITIATHGAGRPCRREQSPRGRSPAGKQPLLRPRFSIRESEPPKKVTKQTRQVTKKKPTISMKANPWQNATRRILTRSRRKIFRLLDLPPELRNLVYTHVATAHDDADAIDLALLTLPPELSLSKQVRSEAVPVFFAANHFTARVRSNYCVFNGHWHGPGHLRFGETGKLELTPVLAAAALASGNDETETGKDDKAAKETATTAKDQEPPLQLESATIRFTRVNFRVDCVCCAPGKPIATLELFLLRGRPRVRCTPRVTREEDAETLGKMFEGVRGLVQGTGEREEFNGFSVEDLVQVARLCVYVEGKGRGGGRGRK